MDKFQLVEGYKGYRNKRDVTNLGDGFLINGSKNVLLEDGEGVMPRKGYTIFGAADTTTNAIVSSTDWKTHRGDELMIRTSSTNVVEVLSDKTASTWQRVYSRSAYTLTSVDFNYAEYWDTLEGQDALLFVNGTPGIYYWTGAITTFSSALTGCIGFISLGAGGAGYAVNDEVTIDGGSVLARVRVKTVAAGVVTDIELLSVGAGYSVAAAQPTTNVIGTGVGLTIDVDNIGYGIIKEGTTTWGEEGFATQSHKWINIGGIEYQYSPASTVEDSTTLFISGTSPDPGVGGHIAGDYIIQEIDKTIDKPASDFNNDLIGVLNNQVYIGSYTSRQVYISEVNDYTDFTFSTPRVVGDAALITLDSPPVAFVNNEDAMNISAGLNWLYKVWFSLSSDLTAESINVSSIKGAPQSSAYNQRGVVKLKNTIAFLTREPTFDLLGRVESQEVTQQNPISDSIKSLFDSLDFTNVSTCFYKNNIYIAVPEEGLVLIYNLERGFWEAPQTLPISSFVIYKDELYGMSNSVHETYKMFQGYKDRETPVTGGTGQAIHAVASFSYQNYGQRSWKKNFNEWFTEGYISESTTLDIRLNYEYSGSARQADFEIDGSNSDILFNRIDDASLGKQYLGASPLGTISDIEATDGIILNKFRIIHTAQRLDFYEMQVVYSSYGTDQVWKLISYGPNVLLSKSDNNPIKI